MLAEMVAINTAYATIKATVMAGKELVEAGSAMGDYFTKKQELQVSVVNAQKKGHFKSDMDEFLALDKIKQMEKQLEADMRLYGRGGLWNDWVKFEAEATRRRKEQERLARLAQIKKQKKIDKALTQGIIVISSMIGVIVVIIGVFAYFKYN